MSPRRKMEPEEKPLLEGPQPVRRRGLLLAAATAAIAAVAATTLCALVLTSHETYRRVVLVDAAAVDYVRSFMTDFSSPDPFHANDYTDRVLAQATGEFAEQYRKNENEILIGVARSEPTTGTVLDAGISRRNDDGSIDVLVITKFVSSSQDRKVQAERTNRWVVTTKQEGQRWKISSLLPIA